MNNVRARNGLEKIDDIVGFLLSREGVDVRVVGDEVVRERRGRLERERMDRKEREEMEDKGGEAREEHAEWEVDDTTGDGGEASKRPRDRDRDGDVDMDAPTQEEPHHRRGTDNVDSQAEREEAEKRKQFREKFAQKHNEKIKLKGTLAVEKDGSSSSAFGQDNHQKHRIAFLVHGDELMQGLPPENPSSDKAEVDNQQNKDMDELQQEMEQEEQLARMTGIPRRLDVIERSAAQVLASLHGKGGRIGSVDVDSREGDPKWKWKETVVEESGDGEEGVVGARNAGSSTFTAINTPPTNAEPSHSNSSTAGSGKKRGSTDMTGTEYRVVAELGTDEQIPEDTSGKRTTLDSSPRCGRVNAEGHDAEWKDKKDAEHGTARGANAKSTALSSRHTETTRGRSSSVTGSVPTGVKSFLDQLQDQAESQIERVAQRRDRERGDLRSAVLSSTESQRSRTPLPTARSIPPAVQEQSSLSSSSPSPSPKSSPLNTASQKIQENLQQIQRMYMDNLQREQEREVQKEQEQREERVRVERQVRQRRRGNEAAERRGTLFGPSLREFKESFGRGRVSSLLKRPWD